MTVTAYRPILSLKPFRYERLIIYVDSSTCLSISNEILGRVVNIQRGLPA